MSISIVIPAFNEEKRLPQSLESLQRFMESTSLKIQEVLVVDDASTDETLQLLIQATKNFPKLRILSHDRNSGKGAALRSGVLKSISELILVADADESTPWTELEKLEKVLVRESADLVMGSRALEGSQILTRQHPLREKMGRTFNLILRTLCGLKFKDTQCGFKLFRNTKNLQTVFSGLETKRFAYDVEVILKLSLLRGKIIEWPVIWAHKDESRVHPFFDSIEMFFSVLKLRLRLMLRRNT